MGALTLGFVTFLAAFLLFEIEFIIAKIFLPGYGGSYLVWGACVVFFQAVLLLGYWFAHHFIGLLGWARYRYLHLGLLLVPLLFFPGRELNAVFVNASIPLVIDVFWRLTMTIGPVFFVLSTMSIATQMWMSRSRLQASINPYRLYAVSNLGSFIALFSYPFFFEVAMDLSQQLMIWRVLYGVLIVANIAAFFAVPIKEATEERARETQPVEPKKIGRWILLGAGGSMIFLSVNNIMTYELPPVPLFWVFPLSVYLLSFVLNFKKTPWCPSWIIRSIAPIIGSSALFYLFMQKYDIPPLIEFAVILGILFCLCMFCQNKLMALKPQEEGHLTRFYFFISLGSFLGGIVTTWIIPLVSVSMVEYICALLVIAMTLFDDEAKPLFSARASRIIIYLNLFYYVWSALFLSFNILAAVLLFFLTVKAYRYLNGFRYGVIASLLLILAFMPAQEKMWDRKASDSTWRVRNYYGIHEIVDTEQVRWLYHGRTLHGGQYLNRKNRYDPIAYYGPQSGIWDLMTNPAIPVRHAAVIGLGTGSMASYFNDKQSMDIFELDPDVIKIAREKFTFLQHSPAVKRFFVGDARLTLKAAQDRIYDLIVVDAFGGDAIPVHLLTKDVFSEYRSHLSPEGIILVHVSNRYVDLVPVLAKVANSAGAQMIFKWTCGHGKYHTNSYWIVISWNGDAVQKILQNQEWSRLDEGKFAGRVWTDQYSSLLPFIRLDYLFSSLKTFNFFAMDIFEAR